MVNMQWIAAISNPQDVAIHPNFVGSEDVTPPTLLATLVGRWPEPYLRAFESLSQRSGVDDAEMALVAAAQRSVSSTTVRDGAEELAALVASKSLRDPAAKTAAAIVSTIAFCELDMHVEAMELIDLLTGEFSRQSMQDADQGLMLALLLQQRGLRASEIGSFSGQEAEEVLRILEHLRPDGLSSFTVSNGIGWDSVQTMSMVVEMLRSAASALLRTTKDTLIDDAWRSVVRSTPPTLLLKLASIADDGYGKYLERSFETATGSASIHIFGAPQYGDRQLYSTLMASEMIGHPVCSTRRSELGMLRFAVPAGTEVEWLRQEAIRLLRHGRDYSHLSTAVRSLRSGGPLSALRVETAQVIERRLETSQLGRGELIVLAGGADLIGSQDASRALDAVISLLRPSLTSTVDTRWGPRGEEAWKAAFELGLTAARVSEVADLMLDDVIGRVETDDVIDIQFTTLLERIDWTSLNPAVRARWISWLRDPQSSMYARLAEAIAGHSGEPAHSTGDDGKSGLTVSDVAGNIDRQILQEVPFPADLLSEAESLLMSGLERLKRRADTRSGEFGGTSIVNVSVAMAIHAGLSGLWEPIADLLIDVRIHRNETSLALDRIGRSPDSVPREVVRRLEEVWRALLREPLDFFGEAIVPYPAALRCLAALKVVSENLVLAECAKLAASSVTLARVEAARTVTTVARFSQPPTWAMVMALQLSHDAEAGVLAEAGRSLAILHEKTPALAQLAGSRLVELLEKDGLLAPILTLRGLGEVATLSDQLILQKIRHLAENHHSFGVRLQAEAVLSANQ